jgi:2-polyprenyl-3-methyl-5-hydroxy-6-metoxy-1,4-benzoquinol methylase
MTPRASTNALIASNIRAHDKIAARYEQRHGEIYNDTEQRRLSEALKKAIAHIETETSPKMALDFGCGAGNVTRHLSLLGCDVLASDVSQRFLDLIRSRRYPTKVEPINLNGRDLSNIADGSLDIVTAYSVLHHIPDYLSLLLEFVRVLKPGGVLFIDHEVSAGFWESTPERSAYLTEMADAVGGHWKKYLKPQNYINWFARKFIDARYQPEGDIHVYEDDHIEWDKIALALQQNGADIVYQCDYLAFKSGYDEAVYRKFKDTTFDTHLLIARRRDGAKT